MSSVSGGGVKRAAESLCGNYTSSVLPDRRRLTDTLPNLQDTKGEAQGRLVGRQRKSEGSFVTTGMRRRVRKGRRGPFLYSGSG